MRTLDRYILKALALNYAVGLAVMLSLYVLLDLFINMDEFTEKGLPLPEVLTNIFSYYWPNVFLFFAQLSGVITLFACLATIARLRRQNELTAMLSSGVSLYRMAVPVVAFGLATTAFWVIDTEWIVPSIAHRLARDHDDVDGRRAYEVYFLPDRDGALLSARFVPRSRDLHRLLVLRRDENGALTETLEADRAEWVSPESSREPGWWRLERARRWTRTIEPHSLAPTGSVTESYPLAYESDLTPKAIELRQRRGWYQFLSLGQLRDLQIAGGAEWMELERARHGRIATPILAFVMLLLGLPFFLDRSPAMLLSDTGRCMFACGLCYVISIVAQSVRTDFSPALPFWIPIFIFGTVAMVLIDRVRT